MVRAVRLRSVPIVFAREPVPAVVMVMGSLFRGARVRGQNLPSATSDSRRKSGRNPRTVASATIQDRSW